MFKLICVVGARPNFMKIAPVMDAFSKYKEAKFSEQFNVKLVHTGQHYDDNMKAQFFTQPREFQR